MAIEVCSIFQRLSEWPVVVAEGTGHGQADELLRRRKVERKVVLTVPHYVGVGHILKGSDLVATGAGRLGLPPVVIGERLFDGFGPHREEIETLLRD